MGWLALVICSALVTSYAASPRWWRKQEVLAPEQVQENRAVVAIGQIKNLAVKAKIEMDVKLEAEGGAGPDIDALVAEWYGPDGAPKAEYNSHAAATVGQLKAVARPFYDRLAEVLHVQVEYPWAAQAPPEENEALVNAGQVKQVFSFEIPGPLVMEALYYQQEVTAAGSAPFGVQARLTRGGLPASGVPVTFQVTSGDGGLVVSGGMPSAGPVTVTSGPDGIANCGYLAGTGAGFAFVKATAAWVEPQWYLMIVDGGAGAFPKHPPGAPTQFFAQDGDGDGISTAQELASGGNPDSNPNSSSPNDDDDGDGVPNGQDAVPYDPDLTYPPSEVKKRYAVVDLGPGAEYDSCRMGRGGHMLWVKDGTYHFWAPDGQTATFTLESIRSLLGVTSVNSISDISPTGILCGKMEHSATQRWGFTYDPLTDAVVGLSAVGSVPGTLLMSASAPYWGPDGKLRSSVLYKPSGELERECVARHAANGAVEAKEGDAVALEYVDGSPVPPETDPELGVIETVPGKMLTKYRSVSWDGRILDWTDNESDLAYMGVAGDESQNFDPQWSFHPLLQDQQRQLHLIRAEGPPTVVRSFEGPPLPYFGIHYVSDHPQPWLVIWGEEDDPNPPEVYEAEYLFVPNETDYDRCNLYGSRFLYEVGEPLLRISAVTDQSAAWVYGMMSNGFEGYQESSGLWANGEAVPLKVLAGEAIYEKYQGWSFCGMSNDGLIGMKAKRLVDNSWRTLVLVPAEIVPDWNRDGKIDDDDRTKVTRSKPWRWWINDDNDDPAKDTANNDTPLGARNLDADSNQAGTGHAHIDGLCDLPDFFPLHLDIKRLLDCLPPTTHTYRISHQSSALRFAETNMCCYDEDDPESLEVRKFLADGDTANELKTKETTWSGTKGPPLTSEFLDLIKGDPKRGILLVEGVSRTEQPLLMEIWKDQDGSKMGEVTFSIKLSDIEDMYRWINLRDVVDPDPEASHGQTLGDAERPTDTREPDNRPDDSTNDKHFVMVHGFNVHEEAARGWGAEVFKRLYQLGMNSKFTMVTWQGNTFTPNDYWENVTNSFITAEHLKSAVAGLPDTKVIAAHSLGNIVVSSAIADHQLEVSKYFMLDAAAPLEAYDSSAQNIESMSHPDWRGRHPAYWSSNWHQRFPDDGRRLLTWRGRFGVISNSTNYYSSGDEVLENGDGDLPPNSVLALLSGLVAGDGLFGAARLAWYRQELGKGRMDTFLAKHPAVAVDVQGGWGFNAYWHITEFPEPSRVRTSTEMQQIPLEDTRERPFFRPLQLAGLMNLESGGELAEEPWVRGKTLAEAIPALSHAAGSNPIMSLGVENNINLMDLRLGWPTERLESEDQGDRWLHSDAKDIAFRFNHPLYLSWLQKGELK